MPTLHLTRRDGASATLVAAPGVTLMSVLRDEGEVEAICGGDLSCATCHVHIDQAWWAVVGEPGPEEQLLLEYSLEKRKTSRLSCQVVLSDAHDGLRLAVAAVEG